MFVYVNENVNVRMKFRPFLEKVEYDGNKVWEIPSVVKMEYDSAYNVMMVFFVVNGKTYEMDLHLAFPNDIVAVYSE